MLIRLSACILNYCTCIESIGTLFRFGSLRCTLLAKALIYQSVDGVDVLFSFLCLHNIHL